MRKFRAIVRAPALSASGYGVHARFLIKSLEQSDLFDVYLDNINWGNLGYEPKSNPEREKLFELQNKTRAYISQGNPSFDVSIQVTIPNEFEDLAPYNIGVTAGIETDRIAPEWIEKCNMMDRVVTISAHSKSGFTNAKFTVFNEQSGMPEVKKVNCPVSVVHYPVPTLEKEDIDLDLQTNFNFLAMALMGNRKNIANTIKWFVEEFKNDEDVGLIVKTAIRSGCTEDKMRTHSSLLEMLKSYPDRKCKVYLLHGRLTEEEKNSLYCNEKVKALVTLSHGEGFGLPIFEAACNGLPIVAPNWSGHVDFLNHEVEDSKGKKKTKGLFSKVDYVLSAVPQSSVWQGVITRDSKWCYAKENSYKQKLRELYKNYELKKSIGKKLQDKVLVKFESEKQHSLFHDEIFGERISAVEVSELPKVSIITSVYDGDNFIETFLSEMTKQSIFREKCELILVNANSPGNEDSVINKYVEKYPENIKYIKLDKDPGIYGVWNHAIENSTGEYIMNANLDDGRHHRSIELHAKTLFLNKEIDLAYSDSFVTHKPNDCYHESDLPQRYNSKDFSLENMLKANLPHNNPMWRRSLHDKHGMFDEQYKSAGDWEMWLRAAFNGSVFKKIKLPLGLYYFNPKGISTNPDNESWKVEEERKVFAKYSSEFMRRKQDQ